MGKPADVLRSLGRFSWSMSVFGATQAARLASSVDRSGAVAEVASALDAVSEAVEKGLSGDARELYRAGEQLQGGGVDAAFGLAAPVAQATRSMASAVFVRGGLGLAELSARTAEPVLGGAPGRRLRELRDKLEVFELFQYAQTVLRVGGQDLASQLEAARRQDTFRCLWLIEGLGYAHGEAAWDGETLDEEKLRLGTRLPAWDLLPLHTGLGLSLARRHLAALRSSGELDDLLTHFEELCRRNAHPGYALPVFEALGLTVRQLAPDLLEKVDAALGRSLGMDRRAAFWHGAGRGLLFLPSHLPPASVERARDKAEREPGSVLGRANALAGLAWATVLVHLRHPEVLAAFLDEQAVDLDPTGRAAVVDGIAGALALWIRHVGGRHQDPVATEPYLAGLVGHVPEPGRFAAEVWGEWVGAAAHRSACNEPDWENTFCHVPGGMS